VVGYGLDDQGSIHGRARGLFSPLKRLTVSAENPAYYATVTCGYFLGGEAAGT